MKARALRGGVRSAALSCVLALVAWAASAAPQGDEAAVSASRTDLLSAAETALARGDTASAIAAFERAALMAHSADTEIGLVRAYMQQGDYRRALAFAAHTAGAHRDTPAASALYARLLSAGGQGAYAKRLLDEAPAHDTQPIAPYALMLTGAAAPPPSARVVASGVLLNDGQHALLPLASGVDRHSALWVRDGLGRTVEVRIERRIEALGLAVVRLSSPLAGSRGVPAARDPFAGSPGYVVGFAATNDAAPTWPQLHPGFVGGVVPAAHNARRLGIDVPSTLHGAPLFDAAGRWSGIAFKGPDGAHGLLTIQRLRDELGEAVIPAGATSAAIRMTPDEVYERALRVALQVIAAGPAP